MLRSGLLAIGLLLTAPSAFSHPVAFKGATGVMTWNQAFLSDSWVTYSFRRDTAVAARFMRMEMPEGRVNYSGGQLDYLVFRDNGGDHQANLYVYGGGGDVQFNRSNGGGYLFGVEADAESRKYFGLLKAEAMRATVGPDFNNVEGRLGVAPYEAEYGELATWFMVQAQWHPSLTKKFVVTPLARIFFKSFMFESGVSLDGDWMMNFMFHF